MRQPKAKGVLEVGTTDQNEIVINHPDLQPDENGVGHIVFSAAQARDLIAALQCNLAVIEPTARVHVVWIEYEDGQRSFTDDERSVPFGTRVEVDENTFALWNAISALNKVMQIQLRRFETDAIERGMMLQWQAR